MADEKTIPRKKVTKKKHKRGANVNTTSKAHSLHLKRVEEALAYRIAGLSYRKIGKQMDVSSSCAHKLVGEALESSASRIDKSADDLRDLELERLDKLLLGVWKKAAKGSTKHSAQALKIMEQHQKLTGIQAIPKMVLDITSDGEPIKNEFHVHPVMTLVKDGKD